MPKSFDSVLSAPRKLFLGGPLPAVPVKLFRAEGGLMPVKLLRGGPWVLVPVKLLLSSEREARRERGAEVEPEEEDMEERGPAVRGEEGRETGADAGGVDFGVLILRDDIESRSLVNIVDGENESGTRLDWLFI